MRSVGIESGSVVMQISCSPAPTVGASLMRIERMLPASHWTCTQSPGNTTVLRLALKWMVAAPSVVSRTAGGENTSMKTRISPTRHAPRKNPNAAAPRERLGGAPGSVILFPNLRSCGGLV
jgi:hypothetical protein